MNDQKPPEDSYNDEEAQRRLDRALKRSVQMKPRPHKPKGLLALAKANAKRKNKETNKR